MRLSLLTLAFTLIITNVYSQWNSNYIKLSENITTQTKKVSGFDKIVVSEDFKVHIRFSDQTEKVEIEANENLHDLIQVESDGSTLKIYTSSYSTSTKKGGAKEQLVAYITAKKLSEIKGNEDVTIVLEDKLYTDQFTLNLNEDSTFEGFLEVQNFVVKLNEDSVLDIKGSAQSMEVKANEDSVINGLDFVVGQLEIKLNEDSKAKLTVNGNIDLRAMEDSYFYYQGGGQFTRKRLTGDSKVTHW